MNQTPTDATSIKQNKVFHDRVKAEGIASEKAHKLAFNEPQHHEVSLRQAARALDTRDIKRAHKKPNAFETFEQKVASVFTTKKK